MSVYACPTTPIGSVDESNRGNGIEPVMPILLLLGTTDAIN